MTCGVILIVRAGLEIEKNPQVIFWQTTGDIIVARCKLLVAILCDVNDAAHSMALSIRFDSLKIWRTKVGINLEVNWPFLCDLAHGMFLLTLLF